MEHLMRIKQLCLTINSTDVKDENSVEDLKQLVSNLPDRIVQNLQPLLVTTFYKFMQKGIQNECTEYYKQLVVETLSGIFEKSKLDEKQVFFNIYGYLLQEIYDANTTNNIRSISEEYKLSIMICVTNLMKSLSWDVVPLIYTKENVPKLCPMLHLALKIARHEKLRSLRIASIECIMAAARVDNSNDTSDVITYSEISNVFIYFLPGIAAGLVNVCVEDDKCGHKLIVVALQAWGRLLTMLMRNYDTPTIDIRNEISLRGVEEEKIVTTRFEGADDVNKYLESVKRTSQWYKEHDVKLELCVTLLTKLTTHDHARVRCELASVSAMLIQNCFSNIPKTTSRIVEILISLSEDEDDVTQKTSKVALSYISEKFEEDSLVVKEITDNLEQNLYTMITKLPRIFNGLDEREQLTSLNLLIGYLRLFKGHKLKQLFFTFSNLNQLLLSLIHVTKLDKSDVSLLEEYTLKDLEASPDLRTPWKNFRFRNAVIQQKLESVCHLLAHEDVSDIALDFLIESFVNDAKNRKEVTLILNEILSVSSNVNHHRIKNLIYTYMEEEYCNLQLNVIGDKSRNLIEVQNNILQICLQLEGMGKMALATKMDFSEFLLKVLYFVLENAGSGHPLLRAAGLSAVTNISIACGYQNVTELINKNSDYFSYHVVRKLKRAEHTEGVLNVFSVVMRHSSIDILRSIADIVDGVLVESFDKYEENNISAYLRVFGIFIKCLHKWLNVKIELAPMKSNKEKEKEIEDLRISNMGKLDNNFSDDIMDQTADEMWNEDCTKSGMDVEEETYPTIEEYKKPEPPTHIKLAVSILLRSLNFLPAKNRERKILVLEILKDGVEILKDWEDELLPIVHKIWSPLVYRFQEFDAPLILNLSFQLLATLARLSKDFIRQRTIKEVLPSISEALRKQSKESYLKDRGSSYRYTQAYKMQDAILPQLDRLFYDLDVGVDKVDDVAEAVEPYLSNKQPLPLQEHAIKFYKTLHSIDTDTSGHLSIVLKDKQRKANAVGNTEWNKNINIILEYMDM